MLFVLNQSVGVSHYFCEMSQSSVKSLLPTYIMLSSAKFPVSASLMKKNKSFKINPLMPGGTKRSYILKQTCS